MPETRPGEEAFLRSYDPGEYPPFALTVDLCVFTLRDGALSVLLVERAGHPFKGFWALPGGHVAHGAESADHAAVRELREETGLDLSGDGGHEAAHLEQLRTYTEPRRDPRIASGLHVASVAYVVLAPDLPGPVAGDDAASARFWPVEDLDLDAQAAAYLGGSTCPGRGVQGPAHPAGENEPSPEAPTLAYDHAVILYDALERVRAKLEYTTLAGCFVSEPFTLADLRRVYAAVWGAAPHLGNFRRKILGTEGFVRASAEKGRSVKGGPAPLLYRLGPATAINPPFMRAQPGGGDEAR
jgi:8-oxo-dGTP diphosphatase